MTGSFALEQAADQLRAEIGQVTEVSIPAISSLTVRRFQVATGSPADGTEPSAVPPILLTATRDWTAGPPSSELNSDGTTPDLGIPKDADVHVLGGGQSITLHRPIPLDSPLIAQMRLTAVNTKNGRTGQLVVIDIERRYFDSAGRELLTCNESRVLR
jgi:N-terminal half of MaoC dehydratase